MPVSGIVIRCSEGSAGRLAREIHDGERVEVHRIVDPTTLVAVIDAPTVEEEVAITSGISGRDGVVSVHLAYHHSDEE